MKEINIEDWILDLEAQRDILRQRVEKMMSDLDEILQLLKER
jgi:hypothetical protein